MIKEGLHTFIDGAGPVTPYQGKYAAKDSAIFDQIKLGWEKVGLEDAPYRPLRIEFELTTKCNDTCPTCGMGALSLKAGRTLKDKELEYLLSQFASVGLPSVAITGGEPFAAMRSLYFFMKKAVGIVDISKLTTNGWWGSSKRCGPTFERLVGNGLLENRYFVPLLMVSIGEQTTPLDRVCRIVNHVVSNFTDRQLNIAVSSLADPATRTHKIYDFMKLYEGMYGEFPHDRVHSTMRVYLENERLDQQAPIHRPGETTITQWMGHCYDCFAPTVGSYITPTALMKNTGDIYSCAAFNVPEKLGFGNLFQEPLKEILANTNRSAYVGQIRRGHGLKGLAEIIPPEVTDNMTCGSYCGSCALLIDKYDATTQGEKTERSMPAPVIAPSSLLSRIRPDGPISLPLSGD